MSEKFFYEDAYASKQVSTNYFVDVHVRVHPHADPVIFESQGKNYAVTKMWITQSWDDSQTIPTPQIHVSGVSINKDGVRGRKHVQTPYANGFLRFSVDVQDAINVLIDRYYIAAKMQESAQDSLGYISNDTQVNV